MNNSKYILEIASDTIEVEEFCKYLNGKGHDATIGNSTGNYVDGECVDNNIEANDIMTNLWDSYCRS